MDFGLYRRPARHPAHRARPARRPRAVRSACASTPRPATTDEALWKELSSSAGPASRSPRSNGGQGLGPIELSILCEELGRTLAPVPFLPSVLAGDADRAGRLLRAARALAAGLASGETQGRARGRRRRQRRARDRRRRGGGDRARQRRPDGRRAGGRARRGHPRSPRSTRLARRRACAPATTPARRSAATCSGGVDRALVAISSELVGVCDRALSMTRRLRQGTQAVRRARRLLSGRLAPLRGDAAGNREGALDGRLRGLDAPTPTPSDCPRQRRWPRPPPLTRGESDRDRDPGPRRHRLHLGGRCALALQARPARRGPARRRKAPASAPGGTARGPRERPAGRMSSPSGAVLAPAVSRDAT